jgi:hypothetical protein
MGETGKSIVLASVGRASTGLVSMATELITTHSLKELYALFKHQEICRRAVQSPSG